VAEKAREGSVVERKTKAISKMKDAGAAVGPKRRRKKA
jgi:hypothetical protein